MATARPVEAVRFGTRKKRRETTVAVNLNSKEIGNIKCPPGFLSLSRDELGRELPPEYVPRTPAILLANCGSMLEAILFCDHFSDVRSSLLMRILADEVCRLNLTRNFLEILRTTQLHRQIELTIADQAVPAACVALGHRYVQSMLEIEILCGTKDLHEMQMFILSQLEVLFAQLPLRVQDTSVLPRPPVYCYQENKDNSFECRVYCTMYCYLQILFISLQKTNRMTIEINRIHELISGETNALVSPSLLTQTLVLILRTTYRDMFTLATLENWNDLATVAAKYNAIIAPMDYDEENFQLKAWLAMASKPDLEHIKRFFAFLNKDFPEKNNLPPLSNVTRPLWYNTMLPKEDEVEHEENDWLSGVSMPGHKVSRFTYDKMAWVATKWTTPLALDPSLIPMFLRLIPADFCSPAPTPSHRSRFSARLTTSYDYTRKTERLFSPIRNITAMFAETGRKPVGTNSRFRTKSANKAKLRSIREKFSRNVNIQRNLREDINDEEGFVEGLSSSRCMDVIDTLNKPSLVFVKMEKLGGYNLLEQSTKEIKEDFKKISKKLGEIQISSKLDDHDNSGESSTTTVSHTEALPQELELCSDATNGFDEEMDFFPLNYAETAPASNPLPQIGRLDFSLLSPTVNVGKRRNLEVSSRKTPEELLARPKWMKLIPLEETHSNRLLLLQHGNPVERVSKTETSIQTRFFQSEITEKGCQTQENERNPPDSGFLDTAEKSPSKKMEMIQYMSKEDIKKMLSQM